MWQGGAGGEGVLLFNILSFNSYRSQEPFYGIFLMKKKRNIE